jgi:hypothetical protein
MRYPTRVRFLAMAPLMFLALFSAVAEPQALPPCEMDTRVNHLVNTSRDERTIRLESRDCRIDLRLRGEPVYTPDFRGIAALPPGGSFLLEEDAGGTRRRLELVDDGRGGMDVQYRVGRAVRPFDAPAEAWLADRLLMLYRRTGLAVDQRAAWLYRTGGVDALLSEIEQVHSSSAHAALVAYAMERPELDDAGVVRLLRSGLPSSSSARARILRAVAARGPLHGEVARAYLDAVAGTSSSSNQRAALEQALRGGHAPVPFVVEALRVVGAISSSSHRAELLGLVAADYAFDDVILGAYLDTTAGISSSAGQRQALTAALARQELSASQLARTLRAVGLISSSSAQGEVLVQVARSRPLTGEARAAYVDVASSISSGSHRARAFEALERGPAR